MLKKHLFQIFIVFSLLFNVQASLAHGIEHHDHDVHDHDSEVYHDCEDCVLKQQVLKSTLVPQSSNFKCEFENEFFDNYQSRILFSETFVAYQSRAP